MQRKTGTRARVWSAGAEVCMKDRRARAEPAWHPPCENCGLPVDPRDPRTVKILAYLERYGGEVGVAKGVLYRHSKKTRRDGSDAKACDRP